MPADSVDIIDDFEALRQILTGAGAIATLPRSFDGIEPDLRTEAVKVSLSVAIALSSELERRAQEGLRVTREVQ